MIFEIESNIKFRCPLLMNLMKKLNILENEVNLIQTPKNIEDVPLKARESFQLFVNTITIMITQK